MNHFSHRFVSALFCCIIFSGVPLGIESWQKNKNVNHYSTSDMSQFVESKYLQARIEGDKVVTLQYLTIPKDLIARQKVQILEKINGNTVVAELIEQEDFVAEKYDGEFENAFLLDDFSFYRRLDPGEYIFVIDWIVKFPYSIHRSVHFETDLIVL